MESASNSIKRTRRVMSWLEIATAVTAAIPVAALIVMALVQGEPQVALIIAAIAVCGYFVGDAVCYRKHVIRAYRLNDDYCDLLEKAHAEYGDLLNEAHAEIERLQKALRRTGA